MVEINVQSKKAFFSFIQFQKMVLKNKNFEKI